MQRLNEFPLQWPNGWKRHEAWERKKGHFQGTWGEAVREFKAVVKQMGCHSPIINTNHDLDSMSYDDLKHFTMNPYEAFPEVIVSFLRKKGDKDVEIIIPCDRWPRLRDNLKALTCSLMALEKVKYWGIGEMLERAFNAYEIPALPPPKMWWDILEMASEMKMFDNLEHARSVLTKEKIQAKWREKVKILHPDVGGYHATMAELNQARDEAFKELGY